MCLDNNNDDIHHYRRHHYYYLAQILLTFFSVDLSKLCKADVIADSNTNLTECWRQSHRGEKNVQLISVH